MPTPKTIPKDDPRRQFGIFGLQDAAKYLGMRPSTVRNWATGGGSAEPIITSYHDNGHVTIPFVGFAEAYALNAFRKAGVPLQRVRPAVAILRAEIGLDYALASRRLLTDGAEVLYQYADDNPDLTVVRTGQKQFKATVEQYLRHVTWGDDGWAAKLELPVFGRASVWVDPEKAFGHPILKSGRARVEDIADRFAAGENMTAIARDFRIPRAEIEDVIRVEVLGCRRVAA